MSLHPIGQPIRQVMCRTALRRLALRYEDWADTQERAAAHWHAAGDDNTAADAYGQCKAYKNAASWARALADEMFPQPETDNE